MRFWEVGQNGGEGGDEVGEKPIFCCNVGCDAIQ